MTITKQQAIRILLDASEKDDPHWEHTVEHVLQLGADEEDLPSIFDVFKSIGVTEQEVNEAMDYKPYS